MGIGLDEDHVELVSTVRRWTAARDLTAAARRTLDVEEDELPSWWAELGGLGWLGLAVSAEHGGQGYGLSEAVIVLEELGRVCAPGPILPTVVAAAAIDRWGVDAELGRPLAEGSAVGGFATESSLAASDDLVSGHGPARVWGGTVADRFLLPVVDGRWCVVDRAEVEVREHPASTPPAAWPRCDSTGSRCRRTDGSRCRPRPHRVPAWPIHSGWPGSSPRPKASASREWCVDTAAELRPEPRAVRAARSASSRR